MGLFNKASLWMNQLIKAGLPEAEAKIIANQGQEAVSKVLAEKGATLVEGPAPAKALSGLQRKVAASTGIGAAAGISSNTGEYVPPLVEPTKPITPEVIPPVTPTPEVKKERIIPTYQAPKFDESVTKDFEEANKSIEGLLKQTFNDSEYKEKISGLQTQMDSAVQLFKNKMESAQSDYEKQKVQNQWSNVAETIGNALVQLAAGVRGVKTGKDMSGVQFSKTDWTANLGNIQNELSQRLGMAEKELGVTSAALGKKESAIGKETEQARADFENLRKGKIGLASDIPQQRLQMAKDKYAREAGISQAKYGSEMDKYNIETTATNRAEDIARAEKARTEGLAQQKEIALGRQGMREAQETGAALSNLQAAVQRFSDDDFKNDSEKSVVASKTVGDLSKLVRKGIIEQGDLDTFTEDPTADTLRNILIRATQNQSQASIPTE